jgi:hypothetical protein
MWECQERILNPIRSKNWPCHSSIIQGSHEVLESKCSAQPVPLQSTCNASILVLVHGGGGGERSTGNGFTPFMLVELDE